MAGSFEKGNELLDLWEFLGQLSDCWLFHGAISSLTK
jgi:hypothetical protein